MLLEEKTNYQFYLFLTPKIYNDDCPDKICPVAQWGMNAMGKLIIFWLDLRFDPQDETQTWHHEQDQESVARYVKTLEDKLMVL